MTTTASALLLNKQKKKVEISGFDAPNLIIREYKKNVGFGYWLVGGGWSQLGGDLIRMVNLLELFAFKFEYFLYN